MNLGRIIEIDFMRCLKAVFRHLKWIAGCGIFSFIVGIILAVCCVDMENVYDAKASVYSIAYGSYSESAEGINVIRTYSEIIKSLRVAERAALLLGDDSLDRFAIFDMIQVEEPEINAYGYRVDESAIINIHASSTDQEDAIRVANAVANAYVMEVTSITMSNSVQVLDEAYYCELTYNAGKNLLLCIGAVTLGGIFLCCGMIVLLEIFSRNVESMQQGALYGELEIMGVIPLLEHEKSREQEGPMEVSG